MCQAKATLAYGLTIRATSLYFVVKAWPQIEPVLPFFALIFLRRRRGTLSALNENAVATRAPDEVWEEIRHQLVHEEIAAAENNLLSELACHSSRCLTKPHKEQRRWYRLMEKKACQTCLADVKEWSCMVLDHWSPEFLQVSLSSSPTPFTSS